jgi:hypothetical protein
VSALDSVRPQVAGLQIRLLDGPIPALFVRNESDLRLLVRGREDEPFLRIGAGRVAANVRSPTYYLAGSQTIRSVPPRADATADPVWKRISDEPVWVFLEYRARVPKWNQERAELGPERKTVLSWTTPAILDKEPMEISGHVEWVPPRQPEGDDSPAAFGWPWYLGAAVVLGAGTLLIGGWVTGRSAATR